MGNNELLGWFLNVKNNDRFSNENRKSCLILALKEARAIAGRDVNGKSKWENAKSSIDFTDEVLENDRWHGCTLLGLTSYLIILDLIGCVFKKKNKSESHDRDGVMNALNNFSFIELEEKKGIKALRNSLTHNFGLANDSHRFSLDSTSSILITIPELAYRKFNSKGKDERSYTIVNGFKICDLVESVYSEVVIQFEKSNIDFADGMYEEKLLENFTIVG